MLASCSRSHVLLSCSLAIVTFDCPFPDPDRHGLRHVPPRRSPIGSRLRAQAASPPRGRASRAARVCRERDTRVRVTVSVTRIPHTRVYVECGGPDALASQHLTTSRICTKRYPFTTISARPRHPGTHMAALRILARGPAGSDSRRKVSVRARAPHRRAARAPRRRAARRATLRARVAPPRTYRRHARAAALVSMAGKHAPPRPLVLATLARCWVDVTPTCQRALDCAGGARH